MCMLGTLHPVLDDLRDSCVKVDKDLPLEIVVLVGCGVPTGWGSAVYAADVDAGRDRDHLRHRRHRRQRRPGRGARRRGATSSPSTRWPTSARRPRTSAPRTASASAEEAHELAQELTRGVGADKAIVTVDIVNEEVVGARVDAIRKGGTAVITGLADPNKVTVQLSGAVMTLYEKTVKGTLFGSGNPMHDIPQPDRPLPGRQAQARRADHQDATRSTRSTQGYQDMLDGKNIRGVIIHEH